MVFSVSGFGVQGSKGMSIGRNSTRQMRQNDTVTGIVIGARNSVGKQIRAPCRGYRKSCSAARVASKDDKYPQHRIPAYKPYTAQHVRSLSSLDGDLTQMPREIGQQML